MPCEVQKRMAEDEAATTGENMPSSLLLPRVSSVSCRICQLSEVSEALISPCLCKGTLAFVHLSCLSRWLNQAGRSYCELCQFRFNTVETRRFGLWRSLKIWMCHPRNWPGVRANLVVGCLLTLFTLGLVLISLTGMKHFVEEAARVGISSKWTSGIICFFMSVVLLLYAMTLALFVRDQFGPWFYWWRHCVNVRLELPPPVVFSESEVQNESCSSNDVTLPDDACTDTTSHDG